MDFAQQKEQKIEQFRAQAQQYHFTREYSKAMTFYVRAGLLGDRESIEQACYNLKSGYGMSYNYDEIFRCMLIGAKMGIADAMYELGVCYSSGLGTAVDEAEAMHWFSEGAKAGNEDAVRSLRTYNYEFSIRQYDNAQPFAYYVRKKVFIEEQGLVDEIDEIDATAKHFVVMDGEKPVACCRLFYDEKRQSFLVGRFAVLKDYRGLHLGRDLMRAVEEYVQIQKGKSIGVHAQLPVRGFYEKLGYVVEGGGDVVQNVPHIWMYHRFYTI